ncbi:MAG TPA: type II toxin-antitoxin system VapC family toxin [Bryobacteraceae bacterium]|nr:type II toxin-antitoxin system VapC family toxin [Bryobacteraceae bacterium]
MTYLDTHVVVWLYDGKVGKLSKVAAEQIQNDRELLVSPAVMLELQFLHDIQRLNRTALTIVTALVKEIGLRICEQSFIAVIESALDQKWVRDPFDRLIVAQAIANEAPLVTKDEKIRRHYRRAIW